LEKSNLTVREPAIKLISQTLVILFLFLGQGSAFSNISSEIWLLPEAWEHPSQDLVEVRMILAFFPLTQHLVGVPINYNLAYFQASVFGFFPAETVKVSARNTYRVMSTPGNRNETTHMVEYV
jgi:hypothetical protein